MLATFLVTIAIIAACLLPLALVLLIGAIGE